jgi:P-type Ca2+ transporter type 2C
VSSPRATHVSPPEVWHQLTAETLLSQLGTSATTGLSSQIAQQRLAQQGPNQLPDAQPPARFCLLLAQFNSLPVLLLAIAAGISLATGNFTDAGVILGVVLINAVIGFVTEAHADRVIRSLQQLSQPLAWVLRDGQAQEIAADDLVPGDILQLGPGLLVPADARLLVATDLSLDESALTGESAAMAKQSAPLLLPTVPLGDRTNMVYRGTLVTAGQGQAVVVVTGPQTEMGRIQALVNGAPLPQTPLLVQLNRVGQSLAVATGVICALLFGLGLLQGAERLTMFQTSIALAVAAVPEGLPAVATTTLALGIQALRRQGVLIRRLTAVETLGAIQVLCLDKTGTLTTNQMAVVAVDIDGTTLEQLEGLWQGPSTESSTLGQLLQIVSLCHEARVLDDGSTQTVEGSPTEQALLRWAIAQGTDVVALGQQWPRQWLQPRTVDQNMLLTLHGRADLPQPLIAVKGNPLEVLDRCTTYGCQGEKLPLEATTRARLLQVNERLASQGLRVLGVARGDRPSGADPNQIPWTWLGLVGLANPLRPGVKAVLAQLRAAGIETLMLTGDQLPTALAIAAALDLGQGHALRGVDATDLVHLPPDALPELCNQVQVFARISPAAKLEIVQALQQRGKVVAMIGDGINDTPALKAAAVGIALGSGGTDVAREVADVVLADDDLATLALAVSQGRTLYRNIRKAVWFLLATNLSEVLVALVATALGLSNPLTARQLLWLNLLTDIFPALALALEPPEQDVLQQPPQDPSVPLLCRRDWLQIGWQGCLLAGSALGAYAYGVAQSGLGAQASTLAFMSLVLAQLLHSLRCRSSIPLSWRTQPLPPNPALAIALAGSLSLQLLSVLLPSLRQLLQLTPLTLTDSLVIAGCALLPLLITEGLPLQRPT